MKNIRFISLAAVLSVVAGANAQFAHLVLDSEEGDYIGQGQQWDVWYEPGTATDFTANAPEGWFVDDKPGLVQFSLMNPGAEIEDRNYALLWFSSEELGTPLAPGFYDDAQRAPFEDDGHPGMDVSFQHRGSNTLTGNFTIKEFTYTGNAIDGYVIQSFVASFEQHSEGGDPALTGHFTYRAVPEPATLAALGLGALGLLARRRRNARV